MGKNRCKKLSVTFSLGVWSKTFASGSFVRLLRSVLSK